VTVAVQRAASRATLLVMAVSHACADLCSGALIGLLPFLVAERHYDLAAAGVFALTASVASALFQPLLGTLGDRGEAHWLAPAGLVTAAVGMAAVGFVTSYPLTLLAVAVCAAGVAAYHPEGARLARHAASSRVTADMSVFSAGGGLGYILGLVAVLAVLPALGLHGTTVVAVIPVAAAVIVALALRRFRALPGSRPVAGASVARLVSEWRPFVLLLALFALASGGSTGLMTYLPLLIAQQRGGGTTAAAAGTTMNVVLLAAAAVGTLLGGILAARLGRRLVLVIPQLVLAPAIALLPSLGYGAMVPVVIVIGLAMNANMSVALVMAQEYLPRRMGLATGLTVGVCGGIGGLIVAALGVLGDHAGLSVVLYVIAALPLAVAVLAARLPRPAAAPPGTLWSLRLES
jgi:MFS transporter, FSR family, fosmidomycin resistance protein